MMIKPINTLSLVFISALTVACGSDNDNSSGGGDNENTTATTFQSIQSGVFEPNCVGCHGGDSPRSGLSLESALAYSSLVGIGSVGKDGAVRVIAGDSANSYIIQKLEGAEGIAGNRMPAGGADPLPAATIQTIKDWIDAGALDN